LIGMSYQWLILSQYFCHQTRVLIMPIKDSRVQRFHEAHFPKLLPILKTEAVVIGRLVVAQLILSDFTLN
jgi:hypothetical protein